jgi:hypothetical protein
VRAFRAKALPVFRAQIVALEYSLQAIASLGPLFDESFPVGHQGAYFAHSDRRNPDGWNQIGGEQSGELDGIPRVGFDPCSADEFDSERMSHRHAAGKTG